MEDHALFPALRSLRDGHAGNGFAAHRVLGAVGKSPGPAGAVSPRRARQRIQSRPEALFRSRPLPDRHYGSTGLGAIAPARGHHGQHDPAPDRRHRTPAPALENRPLAGVRRLLGLDAGARLRAGSPGMLHRLHPPRHMAVAAVRTGLVAARYPDILPRELAYLPGLHPGGGAPRSAGRLSQAADRSRPGRPHAGGAGLEELPASPQQSAAAQGGASRRVPAHPGQVPDHGPLHGQRMLPRREVS